MCARCDGAHRLPHAVAFVTAAVLVSLVLAFSHSRFCATTSGHPARMLREEDAESRAVVGGGYAADHPNAFDFKVVKLRLPSVMCECEDLWDLPQLASTANRGSFVPIANENPFFRTRNRARKNATAHAPYEQRLGEIGLNGIIAEASPFHWHRTAIQAVLLASEMGLPLSFVTSIAAANPFRPSRNLVFEGNAPLVGAVQMLVTYSLTALTLSARECWERLVKEFCPWNMLSSNLGATHAGT